VKDRRFWASLALSCLLLPVLVAAQGERPQAPPAPPPAPSRSSVTLEGREIPVPVTITPGGPLFGLAPLADEMGAGLTSDEAGESLTLKIDQTEVVIGIGSSIITIGDQIVSLSQPPVQGEGGVQVPVELLRKTFGDLLGYSFDWRPDLARLSIARRGAREMRVALDVVHLQGVTTVVLQFSEAPRYHIREEPGTVDVQMLADRLTPPAVPPVVTDPLVQAVTINPQQIRLQLVPGAEVESYVLENPFRLVFDVHRAASVETAPGPAFTRPALEAGVRTIVIDPGHGGRETGAIGPSGVAEKELTLQLARELAGRLESTLSVRAVLTRTEDVVLPHDTRTAIANQNKADLFVSIHLNSSLGSGAHGAETYFLSTEATDSRAARSADAENLDVGGAGPDAAADPAAAQDLQLILWDLAQTHHLSESQRFAGMIQGELNETLQLRDRGVKQAPFRVLMGAAMPAVLVELGFLSNPDEEKKLQDPAYRSDLVAALTRAIGRYKALVENRESADPGEGAAPRRQPAPAAPQLVQPSKPTPPPAAPAPGARPTPRPGGGAGSPP
jgi:N-acetylmuramoyl-L-alanine amidase